MISLSIKRYMQLGVLVAYAGFAYGFNEGTYGDWQAMRAEQLAVPEQPVVKQKSWATRTITQPLKQTVRETLQPTVDFLEQKIATKAPKIAQDEAAYGHVKRMSRYSPEYQSWKNRAEEDFSWAVENPIIVDVPQRKHQEFNFIAENLLAKGDKIYREKKELEAALKNTRFWEYGKKQELRDKLAIVKLDLDSVNNAIDELPMLKAHTRMQAQEVRKDYLDKLKGFIKHPTDRYINRTAWQRENKRFHGWLPSKEALGIGSPDSRTDLWKKKIEYKDQSGMPWLYDTLDEELGSRVYHGSDQLLEDFMAADKSRFYNKDAWPYYKKQWADELKRLEKKRELRGRADAYEKNWYEQQLENEVNQ